ncbi:hypothetical protein J2739_002114 [Variovorax soli]|uniref:Uncharacterized protein n=1 Tax=Variovorax soli TaxID=376815 RepID=A0ABU1NEN1_9BURK|nr:hypothetical protein [Variovorax soli]
MPRDQLAVLGGDQVGFDVVGARLDAQRKGLQRVLGQVGADAAAVADHQRRVVSAPTHALVMCGGRRGSSQQQAQQGGTEALQAVMDRFSS